MSTESIDHYYRVDVQEGPKVRPAYFYSTTGGLYDLRYGFAEFTTRMHESLSGAIEDFLKRLQANHDTAHDGIIVAVSGPVEVTKEEVDRHSPRWSAYIELATAEVKRVIARSIDPINITWAWEWIDDPNAESLVRLRLSAETDSVSKEYTPEELKDESFVRRSILRLFGDLLQKRSERLIEPIRESILEHRGA
jgi:hypothetical protein